MRRQWYAQRNSAFVEVRKFETRGELEEYCRERFKRAEEEMKMKTYAEYSEILKAKRERAEAAAEYCKAKAAVTRDETLKAVYTDIGRKAENEAAMIWYVEAGYCIKDYDGKYGTRAKITPFPAKAAPEHTDRGDFDIFTDIVNAHAARG